MDSKYEEELKMPKTTKTELWLPDWIFQHDHVLVHTTHAVNL